MVVVAISTSSRKVVAILVVDEIIPAVVGDRTTDAGLDAPQLPRSSLTIVFLYSIASTGEIVLVKRSYMGLMRKCNEIRDEIKHWNEV
jgi:hypothetical protein